MSKNKQGKIIAVVGAPASGKSTLISYLTGKYNVEAFMEGEEVDLPKYVRENIKREKNGLQTILFFHNQTIEQYLKALESKAKGKVILLDTFWLSNLFYLDAMLFDKKECELVRNLIDATMKILPLPDTILFLDISNKILKERLEKRGRKFERGFFEKARLISRAHKKYFKGNLQKITTKINADNFSPDGVAKIIELVAK